MFLISPKVSSATQLSYPYIYMLKHDLHCGRTKLRFFVYQRDAYQRYHRIVITLIPRRSPGRVQEVVIINLLLYFILAVVGIEIHCGYFVDDIFRNTNRHRVTVRLNVPFTQCTKSDIFPSLNACMIIAWRFYSSINTCIPLFWCIHSQKPINLCVIAIYIQCHTFGR